MQKRNSPQQPLLKVTTDKKLVFGAPPPEFMFVVPSGERIVDNPERLGADKLGVLDGLCISPGAVG